MTLCKRSINSSHSTSGFEDTVFPMDSNRDRARPIVQWIHPKKDQFLTQLPVARYWLAIGYVESGQTRGQGGVGFCGQHRTLGWSWWQGRTALRRERGGGGVTRANRLLTARCGDAGFRTVKIAGAGILSCMRRHPVNSTARTWLCRCKDCDSVVFPRHRLGKNART